MGCVKALLGVRKTTPSDLCLVEAGIPTLIERVTTIQQSCFTKLLHERAGMIDDPFIHVWTLVSNARTPCARYVNYVINSDPKQESSKLHARIRDSKKSRFTTYVSDMNNSLCVHPMYSDTSISERDRIIVTRIRLFSHNLAIEKGRWSRVPQELRLCTCKEVQTENHVISVCPETRAVRNMYPDVNFTLPTFFNEEPSLMTKLCAEMTKQYM